MERQWGNVEPRAGLAWDPSGDGKMAIRMGGAIANDFIRQDLHENTSSVTPFRLNVAMGGVRLDSPYGAFPGGNPFPYTYDPQTSTFPTQIPFQNFFPIPPDLNTTKHALVECRHPAPDHVESLRVGDLCRDAPLQYLDGHRTEPRPVHSRQLCCRTIWPHRAGALLEHDERQSAALCCTCRIPWRPQTSGHMTQLDDGGSQRYNGVLSEHDLAARTIRESGGELHLVRLPRLGRHDAHEHRRQLYPSTVPEQRSSRHQP